MSTFDAGRFPEGNHTVHYVYEHTGINSFQMTCDVNIEMQGEFWVNARDRIKIIDN